MLVAVLSLALGCQTPSRSSAPAETTAPVAPVDAGAAGQPTPAAAVRAATRPAATDLPVPDAGLAPGSPEPVAVLDLEKARLGVDLPNAIKGMAVAYDPVRDELWHAGIFSSWLIAHDPETGAPLRAVDIEVEGFNPAKMHLDAQRRRLVWVNGRSEQIRVVDLDSGALVERVDVQSRGSSHYPTDANSLDRADGRVWVWNSNNRTLNGYDPMGGETRPLTGITRAFDLSASPAGGKLAVLDAPSPDSARVVVVDTVAGTAAEVCTFTGRPPNHVLMLDDGGLILGEQRLRRVDAACKELWSLELGEAPDSLAVSNGVVVAPLATGGRTRGGIGSDVALVDLETGALRARVPSRWEARHIALDHDGARAFVGNGGDGSATLIPLPGGEGSRVLPLASSADDVVVDPSTGDRYVLSRLGGSRIWRWKADGSVSLFAEDCPWPFALELDPQRRLLIAPSYFEAKLYAWPLDGGPARTIPLGFPGAHGDALGELGYDPATGVAAVVMPMEGWLSVVDVDAGAVRYTRQFEELISGAKSGPGRASVFVSGGSVYVAAAVDRKIWRLDATTDRVLAQGSLPETEAAERLPPGGGAGRRPNGAAPGGGRGGPPGAGRGGPPGGGPPGGGAGGGPPGGGAGGGQRPARGEDRPDRGNLYAFGLFFHDTVGGRLFFGSHVLDPTTLEVRQTLPGDLKVFAADASQVLALTATDGARQDSILVMDADGLDVQRTIPALSTPTAHAETAWDPNARVVYLADLPRARVTGFRVD